MDGSVVEEGIDGWMDQWWRKGLMDGWISGGGRDRWMDGSVGEEGIDGWIDQWGRKG